MKSPDGITRPLWYRHTKIPHVPPIGKTSGVDVCVVGAGIAGLSIAYCLLKEGRSVVVLDEGQPGSGQTGRTSAHLASAIDDRFFEIERLHGLAAAKLAYESHAAGIDAIETIVDREAINCEFARVDGFLSLAASDSPDVLDREYAAARRVGVRDVELLKRGGIGGARCIRFGQQARFHPLKYLLGLLAAIKKMGGHVYGGRRVMDVQGADPKRDTPATVQVRGRARIKARHVVVATNTPSPINDWFGIYTKQSSYRSYVIAASAPKQTIPDALFWDTSDPYHYVRLQPMRGGKSDLLIVGGEDHKTGQPPEGESPFSRLEQWARENFPGVGPVRYRWSGQVQEPADGLAFIGRAMTKGQEVFVVTGDSGMGLTHASFASMLITDLIQHRANPWETLYDPSRKMLNMEFVRENANTLAQYKDLVTGGDARGVADIRKGHGAVIREGLSKLAIYRDEAGRLHRCSAVCTHLQCVVRWNGVERTWDCPCHGSRFDPKGKVLMGPAIDDLPRA